MTTNFNTLTIKNTTPPDEVYPLETKKEGDAVVYAHTAERFIFHLTLQPAGPQDRDCDFWGNYSIEYPLDQIDHKGNARGRQSEQGVQLYLEGFTTFPQYFLSAQ